MISPFSVLFGAGSAVEATSNKDDAGDIGSDGEMVVDESSNDVDQDKEDGENDVVLTTTVVSIDANLEFRIASELVEVTDTLRGCVHAAVALLVWRSEGRKDDQEGTLAAMDECVTNAIDTVVQIVAPDYIKNTSTSVIKGGGRSGGRSGGRGGGRDGGGGNRQQRNFQAGGGRQNRQRDRPADRSNSNNGNNGNRGRRSNNNNNNERRSNNNNNNYNGNNNGNNNSGRGRQQGNSGRGRTSGGRGGRGGRGRQSGGRQPNRN